MARFLAEVERRAFKHAAFALRDDHAALDVVQDAMMRLASSYGGKPAAELPLLFQRILQNAIRDHFRRQKVRSIWTTLLSSLSPADEPDADPLESLRVEGGANREGSLEEQAERAEVAHWIGVAVERLPARQREAFLLRYWEELDVAETAEVMGCSEGSVKTHCSRATHSIAGFLRTKGIQP